MSTWVRAENAAWGCDFAISLNRVMLDIHDSILDFIYSSPNCLDPMAALRYGV